jgi:Glycosyl hydrolases family 18
VGIWEADNYNPDGADLPHLQGPRGDVDLGDRGEGRQLHTMHHVSHRVGGPGKLQARAELEFRSQHPIVPPRQLVRDVTHVALAFMSSSIFNTDEVPSDWPLFTTVPDTRTKFEPGTKIIVAIGGWGDTAGFEVAARDHHSRTRWAHNVAAMVNATGADGVCSHRKMNALQSC